MKIKAGIICFAIGFISLAAMGIARVVLQGWIDYLWIPFGLGFGGIILGLIFERKSIKEFMTVKTTKQGMSMGLVILLFIVILITINFIGVRKYKTWDFSQAQQNSISEQSQKIVSDLKEDLKVIFFYSDSGEQKQIKEMFARLLRKYQDVSQKVKLEFYDVTRRPDIVEKYKAKPSTAIIEYKGRTTTVAKIDEQEITSGIVKVMNDKESIIYVTTGHGERSAQDEKSADGLFFMKKSLEGTRYTVKELNLLSEPNIPQDATAVIVAGPTQAFSDVQLKTLKEYFIRGGSLLLAFEQSENSNLNAVIKDIGVEFKNNFVVQVFETPFGTSLDPRRTVAQDFGDHAITKPFDRSQAVLFKLPGSLIKSNNVNGITVEEFLKTGPQSVSFSNLDFLNGEVKDLPKASPTVAAISVKGKWPNSPADTKEFNLVLFADADFMSNGLFAQSLNRMLVLNSVSYLAKEDNLISIPPKDIAKTELKVTQTGKLIMIVGFLLIPIIMLISSVTIWVRRRYA